MSNQGKFQSSCVIERPLVDASRLAAWLLSLTLPEGGRMRHVLRVPLEQPTARESHGEMIEIFNPERQVSLRLTSACRCTDAWCLNPAWLEITVTWLGAREEAETGDPVLETSFSLQDTLDAVDELVSAMLSEEDWAA